MSNWMLQYNYGSWSTAYNIESPTNDLSVKLTSNLVSHKLVDGTIGRIIPNNKMVYDNVEVSFDFISGESKLIKDSSGALGTKSLSIRSIMSAGYPVKLTTHQLYTTGVTTTSQVWQGYFTSHPKLYKLGMYKNQYGNYSTFYDVSVTMDLMSVT